MHLDFASLLSLISTVTLIGALIFTGLQVRAANRRRLGIGVRARRHQSGRDGAFSRGYAGARKAGIAHADCWLASSRRRLGQGVENKRALSTGPDRFVDERARGRVLS